MPWRGSCSAIFGRIEASPVSRPPWNGALAASAAITGSHGAQAVVDGERAVRAADRDVDLERADELAAGDLAVLVLASARSARPG